ncbi:hypothetical protein [Anaerobranca gottschalkii]|uniref:Uncharacterized protein n=1 Tax=Anaerobranca gottschalkii DSM 13577 TaxID=1120990 RepID=A0A1I0C4S3_9FIRM|nr:hypothetical protein [Anaerobranca gottschalkii]SET14352.1 hypothetical protein SAMN03080614_10587 [Anaerobranca gottschalkii DSM 13577]
MGIFISIVKAIFQIVILPGILTIILLPIFYMLGKFENEFFYDPFLKEREIIKKMIFEDYLKNNFFRLYFVIFTYVVIVKVLTALGV